MLYDKTGAHIPTMDLVGGEIQQRPIVSITLTNGGSGYGADTTVEIDAPTDTDGNEIAGGVHAEAIAIVENGEIVGLTITNAGSGYTSAPNVDIVDTGGGNGASVTVSWRKIIGFEMINHGHGYTSAPTVTIRGNGSGSGASATAVIGNNVVLVPDVLPGSSVIDILDKVAIDIKGAAPVAGQTDHANKVKDFMSRYLVNKDAYSELSQSTLTNEGRCKYLESVFLFAKMYAEFDEVMLSSGAEINNFHTEIQREDGFDPSNILLNEDADLLLGYDIIKNSSLLHSVARAKLPAPNITVKNSNDSTISGPNGMLQIMNGALKLNHPNTESSQDVTVLMDGVDVTYDLDGFIVKTPSESTTQLIPGNTYRSNILSTRTKIITHHHLFDKLILNIDIVPIVKFSGKYNSEDGNFPVRYHRFNYDEDEIHLYYIITEDYIKMIGYKEHLHSNEEIYGNRIDGKYIKKSKVNLQSPPSVWWSQASESVSEEIYCLELVTSTALDTNLMNPALTYLDDIGNGLPNDGYSWEENAAKESYSSAVDSVNSFKASWGKKFMQTMYNSSVYIFMDATNTNNILKALHDYIDTDPKDLKEERKTLARIEDSSGNSVLDCINDLSLAYDHAKNKYIEASGIYNIFPVPDNSTEGQRMTDLFNTIDKYQDQSIINIIKGYLADGMIQSLSKIYSIIQ